MPQKKCSDCDFAILDDYGYSNYTVEGTTVICSKGLNPHGEFDRWYGEDDRDVYAETCRSFQATDGPAEIDVDREAMPLGADYETPAAWEKYATRSIPAARLSELLA